jgi:putative transposase
MLWVGSPYATPIQNRGLADILIAVVDGLKGFPDAINAAFHETVVQACIVHLLRNSMGFASWKHRKLIAQALRAVYRADTPKSRRGRARGLQARPLGQALPRHHPKLASTLGPGDPVFV